MGTTALLTVEQFVSSPEFLDESHRLELRNGEVVDMGETNYWHNDVRDAVLVMIRIFAKQNQLGKAMGETGFALDSSTWLRADMVYWDTEHAATIDPDTSPIRIIPQLVMEVASPSNRVGDLFSKVDAYLRAGVEVVWVVIRRPYEIHVFEANGGRRIVRAGEKLEAPALLPGFSLGPKDLLPT